MKLLAPRARLVVAVTICCLGWNCLCLLMRSHTWSRETYGVAEKSDLWSINAIIDFVYVTNSASDIILIWVICYQSRQRKTGIDVDSKPLRNLLRLFIAWNGFAIFLLWCASCATLIQRTVLRFRPYAQKAVPNETLRANSTIGAMVGLQDEDFDLWTPLAIFSGVAFGRVALLLYCFVGYLGFLKSEAAVDSVFDEPVDITHSSCASLSSMQPVSHSPTASFGGHSSVHEAQCSTSPASHLKAIDTTTPTVEIEPKRRKPKRRVCATPTLTSLCEGVPLHVVPGPSFQRPSYVCSVSPPLSRIKSDDARSDNDLSTDSPASLEAIQAAAFSSIFGSAPRRFSYAFPSLVDSIPQPLPDQPRPEKKETAAAQAGKTMPASQDVSRRSSRESEAGKRHEHGRRGKGKRIAFSGSRSRRSSRATRPASVDTLDTAQKRRTREKTSGADVDPSTAADESHTGYYNDDDDNRADPIPCDSFVAAEGSSEIVDTVLGIRRAPAALSMPFLFRTPPSMAAPQGPRDDVKNDVCLKTAVSAPYADEAVQTEDTQETKLI